MGNLTKRDRVFLTGGIVGTVADKMLTKASIAAAEAQQEVIKIELSKSSPKILRTSRSISRDQKQV